MKRELLDELRSSWAAGAPIRPEELLARWPVDPQHDSDLASLLFEDFCQRLRHGEEPTPEEYERLFPEHQDSLARLLRQYDFLRSLSGSSISSDSTLGLPAANEELFGFHLERELGHGSFAMVFLARQTELAGRPVVLKVSAISGNEPQMLAQLQHTHIVPIYSLHEDQRAGLRAVCMPFFGGATLGQVLERLWADRQPPIQGEQLARALETVQARGPDAQRQAAATGGDAAPTAAETPLALLRRLPYVQAAAWITGRLAEALHHAHQRGVLHRDIKPSNILLGADGQPMLLDFNLAEDIHNTAAEATLGGTVAYMAPEHLRALAAQDPALVRLVDHRSDLYSLGLVLYEMLVGRSAFEHKGSYAPLRELIDAMAAERSQGVTSRARFGPTIPRSLESVVRKCLAPDPAQRYQRAEDLAEDLQRFLQDRPLRHAPELSWTERLGKWARRHPRLTSSGSVATIAAGLLLAVGAILYGIQQRLEVAQARERRQAFDAGTVRSLCLVNTTTDVQDHLPQGLATCEETLALYGSLERDDWQTHPDWRRLDPEERQRLAEDVRELFLLLAWGRVRTSPKDPAVLSDALALLDRAEAIADLKPSRALWRDRALYLQQLGAAAKAKQAQARANELQPASARDHYLLATSYARQGRDGYSRAVAESTRALQLNPRHYWSLVQRGICYQELGEHTLAVADFSNCIGLWPEFAWGYFNRGCALDQGGKKREAIRDYSAALKRDPDLVLALLNRGRAYLELKQYSRALADLQNAQQHGRDDAVLHAGQGMALEGLGRSSEADSAFQAAFARCATASAAERSRIRCAYGFAVSARRPDLSRNAFAQVLADDPRHPQALYGQAMLLVEQGQLRAALSFFREALDVQPDFVEARRFRGVVQARLGQFTQARSDVNWCLAKEPEAGATLYAAACVAALTAEKAGDPTTARQAAGQALEFLRQAFHHAYGQDKAAHDPDLAGIRNLPAFQQLLAKTARETAQ